MQILHWMRLVFLLEEDPVSGVHCLIDKGLALEAISKMRNGLVARPIGLSNLKVIGRSMNSHDE